MTLNRSNFFQQLAEATKPRLIERATNQPAQRETKRLLTSDELFWLGAALMQKFHQTSGTNARHVATLTEKLGNILDEPKLQQLAEEFKNDLSI